MNALLIRYRNGDEKIYSIKSQLVKIGSGAVCEICIQDNRVPHVAGVLVWESDGIYFKTAHAGDLVRFNGEAVPSIRFTPGDKIQIGDVVIMSSNDPDRDTLTRPMDKSALAQVVPTVSKTIETTSAYDKLTQSVISRPKLVKFVGAICATAVFGLLCWGLLDFIFAKKPEPIAPPSSSAGLLSDGIEIFAFFVGGDTGQEAVSVLRNNSEQLQRWNQEINQKLTSEERQELNNTLATSTDKEQALRDFFSKSEDNQRIQELRNEIKSFIASDEFKKLKEDNKDKAKELLEDYRSKSSTPKP